MTLGPIRQTRKIRPTHRSVSGIYIFRGKTAVPYESTLERDFIIRSEFFSNIREIVPQPVRIPFLGRNGQTFTYTPDFLVWFTGRSHGGVAEIKPLLVEVKPAEVWRKNWRKWATKWKTARRFALEHGWSFRICDESRIRDQVLANISYLDRFKRRTVEEVQAILIIDQVSKHRSTTIADIWSSYYKHNAVESIAALIWHLVAMRRLDCQMDWPLTNQTPIWVTER